LYHALLTNRYLTSRVIPLIAVGAVALCVALVIVVVSVMTGFLDMVKSSGRKLMGDVVVSYPVSGIPYYERLITKIESLPEAEAAAPVVDHLGLLKMPYPDGPNKQTETVQLWGIDERFAKVTGFEDAIVWKKEAPNWTTIEPDLWRRMFDGLIERHWKDALQMMDRQQRVEFVIRVFALDQPADYTPPTRELVDSRLDITTDEQWINLFRVSAGDRTILEEVLTPEQWQQLLSFDRRLLDPDRLLKDGLTLKRNGEDAIALGIHVSEGNDRQKDGTYRAMSGWHWWMPSWEVTLTTLPISGGGLTEPESVILPVANEYASGVFLIDDKRVMIPLHVAQRLLHLDQAERVDEDDPTIVIGEDPARATMVLIRAKPNVSPEQLRDAVEAAYDEFRMDVLNDPNAIVVPPAAGFGLGIRTWEQQQASFIGPVENERELMRTLFSIVYIVCGALILSIFWAFVFEKTRDIGILRSIGAGRTGIMWVFLRYGFWIGLVGGLSGVGLAYVLVRNINPIHTTLGSPPIFLAVLAGAPCLIALIWIVFKANWQGIALLSITILALAAASGGVWLTLWLLKVDAVAFATQYREFLIGAALLIILFCAVALGEAIPRHGLIPAMLGTLLFIVSAGLAAGIWAAHQYGGFVMWNPEVYYFTEIPNEMDWRSAWGTMFLALTFSLLGASIPAAKAADTDPVRALRYE